MKKIEHYESDDGEFTGTKEEVLKYELKQSKGSIIMSFCDNAFCYSDNNRKDIASAIEANIDNVYRAIQVAEKEIKEAAENIS